MTRFQAESAAGRAGFITIGQGVTRLVGHPLAASVPNAPVGSYLANIMEPETATPGTVDASRIAGFGLRAMIAGNLAAFTSSAIAGVPP